MFKGGKRKHTKGANVSSYEPSKFQQPSDYSDKDSSSNDESYEIELNFMEKKMSI